MKALRHSAFLIFSINVFLLLLSFIPILFCSPETAEAKIYIDITAPAFKRFPIAIEDLSGLAQGQEIASIIRDDLDFTGIFQNLNTNAFIEGPDAPFDPKNWIGFGVEAVLKGKVTINSEIVVETTLYDPVENKTILKGNYRARPEFLRAVAHSISNDIYKAITGEDGIFRSKIACVIGGKGTKDIYIMDWDGGNLRRVTAGLLDLSPRWSPDGKHIAYSSLSGESWRIYLLNIDTLKMRQLFSSQGMCLAGGFSPDGRQIAFASSKNGSPGIFIMDTSGSDVRRLTSHRGIDVSPTFSPDGSKIAFVSDRGGSPQIYIMDADGKDIRRLTFKGGYNTSPVWSPRGDKIAYVARIGSSFQIFLINPDGSGLTQLTTSGSNEDPSFSPDGRYITFSSYRDGSRGIYIMRANGDGQKMITRRGITAVSPRWSPMIR